MKKQLSKEQILDIILKEKIVAIVRTKSRETAVAAAHAMIKGGICVVEVTLGVPDALNAIKQLRDEAPENVIVGAGTVLNSESCQIAAAAGAQFIVTPNTVKDTISTAANNQIPILCGAYTATEVVSAMSFGADIVKIFPADCVTPSYIKALLAPLPNARLMPTGGITLDNAAQYLKSGAVALGVGGSLSNGADEGKYAQIEETARLFVRAAKG